MHVSFTSSIKNSHGIRALGFYLIGLSLLLGPIFASIYRFLMEANRHTRRTIRCHKSTLLIFHIELSSILKSQIVEHRSLFIQFFLVVTNLVQSNLVWLVRFRDFNLIHYFGLVQSVVREVCFISPYENCCFHLRSSCFNWHKFCFRSLYKDICLYSWSCFRSLWVNDSNLEVLVYFFVSLCF